MVALGAGTAGSGPSHSESPELDMAPREATVRPPHHAGSAGSPDWVLTIWSQRPYIGRAKTGTNQAKTQGRHM